MPRYYFYVLDRNAVTDEDGEEFPDIEAAKVEAIKLASGILAGGLVASLWQGQSWRIVVSDSTSPESGHTFFTLTLSAQE